MRKNRGTYVSGEELAITAANFTFSYLESNQRIKKKDIKFISATNKGYCLSDETDVISTEGIGPYLTNGSQDMIHVLKPLIPLNLVAKKWRWSRRLTVL